MSEPLNQMALDCRRTADEILAFLAGRADAPPIDESDADRLVAVGSEWEKDFSIQFGDRLQHLLIRLSDAGYGTDALDPLTYGGTTRLGARSAAEALRAISIDLLHQAGRREP